MKKMLVLGGSDKLMPVIQYASQRSYYLIVCDYLADNPGRHFADEFYHISTTDQDAVLDLAKKKDIDGIVSYSSDVNALTAAYVGSQLELPSNPYHAVLTLTRKDLFRKFLSDNQFSCPKVGTFTSFEGAQHQVSEYKLPFMVKPVDLAGSQGVTKVDKWGTFEEAFHKALALSKEKQVIIEEYIQMNHQFMIAGDAFVLNGKLIFMGLLNSHRGSALHPFIPTGTSYPILLGQSQVEEVTAAIQRVVDLLGIRFGGLNLELMYDKKGDLYIIEIAPRNGGNMIPELLEIATGFDMVGALVEASAGRTDIHIKHRQDEAFYSTYVLHSNRSGILKGVKFSQEIAGNVIRQVMYVKKGEHVFEFDDARKAIGILFLKFQSQDEEMQKLQKINSYVEIILDR